MARNAKKYKTDSKSLNKILNLPFDQREKKIRGMALDDLNRVMANLDESERSQHYSRLNPEQKKYVDLNIDNPKGRSAGVFRSEKPHFEKISQLTPEQSNAAYAFLQNTIPEAFLPENATQEQMQAARSQGLTGTLSALEKPYESPLNTQLNAMFGHMANPVLQGFLNPSMGQNAQVMFPSQLQQQMSPGIEGLLSQLASSGISQGVQGLPAAYQYAQENAPAAYNYAAESRPGQFVQNLPGNFMGLLSSLGNRIRGPQQSPQQ